ncbi:MAG TPA: adenylate/guanylate cyclase domain-containing protein, partial [Candidatus Acetothermia bacterium]|nr:adenylate/guanylate cyclase domain-containing protein [Candidatus Acetothermia bacterium]
MSWSRTLKVRQMLRAQLEVGEPISLLFSDIRGFSTYAVRRGDRAAFQLTQLHEGILKDRISEYGILVKSLGDGVMAAFESSLLAVQAAVAIQRAFRERNAGRSAEPVDVGIGIAAGTPVMTDIDFIGHSVNLAQRLSALAKSGQILVPSQLAAHARLPHGLMVIPVGDRMLKGLGSYSLSEVAWMGEVARVSDAMDQVTLILTQRGSMVV